MLQMAEKEIILKSKQIEALETYISGLQKDGNVDMGDLQQVRDLLAIEQKKIETAFQQAENEETKTEIDTVTDQESKFDQSEVSSSSSENEENNFDPSMMIAPTTGNDQVPPDFRHSVLSANALTLDDIQQDTDKMIDKEIKQNLEKQEAQTTMLSMDALLLETPDKNIETIEESKASIVVPIEEPPQTINEDELIDQNGEFIIFAETQQSEAEMSQ